MFGIVWLLLFFFKEGPNLVDFKAMEGDDGLEIMIRLSESNCR